MKSEEDMHEKPEKRDVVDNINPEGKHDAEKQVHEKPEKSDMMVDINPRGQVRQREEGGEATVREA